MSTREVTSTCAWFLAANQNQAPPDEDLYLLSTSTLAQRYPNFGIISLSVTSPTFSEVKKEMRYEIEIHKTVSRCWQLRKFISLTAISSFRHFAFVCYFTHIFFDVNQKS